MRLRRVDEAAPSSRLAKTSSRLFWCGLMKTNPKIIERILGAVNESRSFCVVGHIRPDGDCVGSQLGLTMALRNEGKKVLCWNEDPIPQKYEFLDPERIFQRPKRGLKFDCVIATDAASFERLGTVGRCVMDRKTFVNIDHHESNTRYADINWLRRNGP
jgi:bifunctional oligoribonuclease and PAP phosphatase NrnA